jgi:hypothetical protein
MEFPHHLLREQIEALANVLMAGLPCLVQQNDLIDMRRPWEEPRG